MARLVFPHVRDDLAAACIPGWKHIEMAGEVAGGAEHAPRYRTDFAQRWGENREDPVGFARPGGVKNDGLFKWTPPRATTMWHGGIA